ncbi:hypothetical protein XF30_10130 [Bradyrhizobium sp. SUTN9-2]|nr:hypothetical protein XF30_10130 [Bradyrhizobium sp. SUTN9-2]
MRFIRFILIDLALMLLAPECAKATIMATDANFESAREAVGSVMPSFGPSHLVGSGVIRQLTAKPLKSRAIRTFIRSPRPAKRPDNLGQVEGRLPLNEGQRATSDCHNPSGAELLNKTRVSNLQSALPP